MTFSDTVDRSMVYEKLQEHIEIQLVDGFLETFYV